MTRATGVLFTGFPAFRARRILAAVAAQRKDADLIALVHPSRLAEARAVSDELAQGARLELVAADPSALDFGLPGARYLELAARVREVHAAYSITDPDVDAALTESVNLGAARELVEFSRVARDLDRLVLYSSVFVSGDRRGRVAEGELEAGQSFRNAAERSLALGERMVRRSGAPLSVIRAGHLLGDSSNGGIDRPTAPYLCMALVLTTPEDTPLLLPPFADAPLPVTPVDYLAEVGAAAPTSLPAGRTVHAIEPSPLTLGGFIELLAELLGKRLDGGSKPSAVARALFSNPTARLLPKNRRGLLEVLTTGGEYATDGAMELSARGGPVCPPLTSYITRVVDHVRKRIEQGSLDPKGREEAAFLIA